MGVSEPSELEVEDARRYLKQRQIPYTVFYLALSIGNSLLLPSEPLPLVASSQPLCSWAGSSPKCSRGGGVAAPRVTLTRPHSDPRTSAGPLVGTHPGRRAARRAGAAERSRAAQTSMSAPSDPHPVPVLTGVAAAALFSAASVWLAVHRPARCSDRVDEALRLRSARVSAALATLAAAAIAAYFDSPATGWIFATLGLTRAIETAAPVRGRRPADAAASGPPHPLVKGSLVISDQDPGTLL